MSKAKAIQIAAARKIAEAYGYDQVVIYARKVSEIEGGEHMTTYGRTPIHCKVAAAMAAKLQTFMGWKT